jgi:hypothetical protein
MATLITVIRKDAAIAGLIEMAQDWRKAANGQPLTEIKGNVGLLMLDFAGLLGISATEAENILDIKTED